MLHALLFAALGAGAGLAAWLLQGRPRTAWPALAGILAAEAAGWAYLLAVREPAAAGQSLLVALFAGAVAARWLGDRLDRRDSQPAGENVAAGGSANIPALDGLRGTAILLVVLGHSWTSLPITRFDQAAWFWSLTGGTGVYLFFVLSGYLITSILYEARGKPGYFRNFYARRVLRIFPLYYGVLLAYFVVLPWLGAAPELGNALGQQAWYWLYVSNFAMATHHDFAPATLGVTWSLAIEEQFYLLWPPIVLLLPRRWLIGLCSALFLGATLWRTALVNLNVHPFDIAVFTPSQVDFLAVGALVALSSKGAQGLLPLLRLAPRAFVLTALVVIGLGAAEWGSPYPFFFGDVAMQTMGNMLMACMYGALLVMALGLPAVARAFEHRWLRSAGRHSYAMYLLHLPVIGLVGAMGAGFWAGAPRLLGWALPSQLVFTALVVALSLLAGWVSWHYFERPILSLKRYFESARPSGTRTEKAGPRTAPALSPGPGSG
jgi:peptidoglycan/LPS O-acetylase OafA/YrhL